MCTLLFTSNMLMSVIYTILTGATTLDRLRMRANNNWDDSGLEEIPLKNVFGIAPKWMWMLPVDPIFDDHDRVVGFMTREQLLRQQDYGPSDAAERLYSDGISSPIDV